MRRIAGALVAVVGIGVGLWAQTALEGSFHMHALARIDGDRFAIASGRTVEVRSFSNPARPLRVLSGAQGRVSSLAATADGRYLAAGDQDGHVLLWDLATGALLFRNYAHVFTVWTVAFSPDGTLLASGAFDARVKLWEVPSGRQVGILIDPRLVNAEEKDRAHVGWVRCVTFSPTAGPSSRAAAMGSSGSGTPRPFASGLTRSRPGSTCTGSRSPPTGPAWRA